MSVKLEFKASGKIQDVTEVFNYNIEAFKESPDFPWALENIKKQLKAGWQFYSVILDGEMVAAFITKKDKDSLLTKNTPIKMAHRGKGLSHEIKEYYEQLAKDQKLKRIVNYCRKDNFRGISLNETHGYDKTGNLVGDNKEYVEWFKKL